jgi:hypothetical protein
MKDAQDDDDIALPDQRDDRAPTPADQPKARCDVVTPRAPVRKEREGAAIVEEAGEIAGGSRLAALRFDPGLQRVQLIEGTGRKANSGGQA